MAILSVAQALELIDGLDIPATQLAWRDRKPPPPPYVVLVPHESRHDYKDGHVLRKRRAYDFELYTRERDIALEQRIEHALDEAEVAYSSDVTMDEENKYCVTYFSTTLIEQEAT